MSPSRALRWKKTKTRGLFRFVVFQGILFWACTTFVALAVLMYFTDFWPQFVSNTTDQPHMTFGVLVLAGAGWALAVWLWEDWAYRRYIGKNGVPPGDS